jgi:hypothetical protein
LLREALEPSAQSEGVRLVGVDESTRLPQTGRDRPSPAAGDSEPSDRLEARRFAASFQVQGRHNSQDCQHRKKYVGWAHRDPRRFRQNSDRQQAGRAQSLPAAGRIGVQIAQHAPTQQTQILRPEGA